MDTEVVAGFRPSIQKEEVKRFVLLDYYSPNRMHFTFLIYVMSDDLPING